MVKVFRILRKRNIFFVALVLGMIVTSFANIGYANQENSFLEGYNHGVVFQKNIQNSIDTFFTELRSRGYNIAELREDAKETEDLYAKILPEKIQYMKGIADATLIDYNDILLINCFDKLTSSGPECFSVLAHGNATRDGVSIIAKNRDSEADSINALELREHRYPGEEVYKAAYIDIPQAEETYKHIGVKKVARWGYGQGINEFQVSIIDNDAASMDDLTYREGLHDNDYIRLALERSKTAREAVEVIGKLTEKYSQSWNAIIFTIGDPNEIWLMEVAGYQWVAKKCTDTVMAIANQFQLTDNYDLASADLVSYALEHGLIDKETSKINFREVYGAKALSPKEGDIKVQQWPRTYTDVIREERGMELLNEKIGEITEKDIILILQDHHDKVKLEDGTEVDMQQIPYYSSDFNKINQFVRAICHHDIRNKTCVSSVFVSRPGIPNELGIMWNAMGQPCQTIYVPFYIGINSIAEDFTNAKGVLDFYLIRDYAFGQYTKYKPIIRGVFDTAQKTNYFLEPLIRQEAIEYFEAGNAALAKQKLTDFCYERATKALHDAKVVLDKMTDHTVAIDGWQTR